MDKNIYFIGNAHLDPVWQWRFPEGLALVKSTFQAALDRMDEYPDYVFTSACAGYYKWLACTEPEMFERIKEKVREGRWCVTGGMWVQPDCNIPSGEAFARHLLYSQRFFKENFGFTVKTSYNVDSFGHNGMLPQLFIKSGIENYVYHRPDPVREKPGMTTEPLHIWESPDGSRVLCWHIPDGYGGEIRDERVQRLGSYNYPAMFFYGVGNHGGGPTVRMLDKLEALRKEDPERYLYSGTDKYFDDVRAKADMSSVPVVSEDLQHHASGCYSANATVKAMNRRAEEGLVRAEKMDVLASALTGMTTYQQRITRAWERVMFNQFHDILAGCSIKPAYRDAYDAFGAAELVGTETSAAACERISWRVNTTKFFEKRPSEMRDRLWLREGEGGPVVVFNPHSFPVKTNISFGMGWVSGVLDSEDNEVPFQIVRAPYTDGMHYRQCMFETELQPYGYATYFIYKEDQNYQPKPVENEFTATANSIENSLVKLVFDPHSGCVTSWVDKTTGRELTRGGFARGVIVDDSDSDTWAHMIFEFARDVGEFSDARLELVEEGPLRMTMKVTTSYNRSVMSQYFSLTRGSNHVDVSVRLNFQEHYRMLKLSFPMNVEDPRAVYSMPFGFIEKPVNGQEEPSQKWVDVCSADGTGVALVNDGKYSFSVRDGELRMVAARGCAFLDHYGQKYRDNEIEFLDQGEQSFAYTLIPHGESRTDIIRTAELLNMPCELYQETHHTGDLPAVYGGMSVSVPNVIVQAIKNAEDGSGIVIRAFESEGKAVDAEISLDFIDTRVSASFGPQEVKTILIPSDRSAPREVLITEFPIEKK